MPRNALEIIQGSLQTFIIYDYDSLFTRSKILVEGIFYLISIQKGGKK